MGLLIVVGILFLPCLSIAFNSFGLDSPLGLDRYTLLPLSGKEKLLSKNLAFAAVMLALFITIVPLAVWKLGLGATVLGFLALIVLGLAYTSYGNWMSVRHPFKMQFYRFASRGSPVDAVMGMIFGSLPGIVLVYLSYRESYSAWWVIAVLLLLYVWVYFVFLGWSARVLEKEREVIRRSLS